MRLNVAIFFGALFGALGVLLFLVAFGSDYWLLATEVGRCSGEQNVRFFFKISLLRAALGTILKSSQGWGIYFFIEELCRDLVVIIMEITGIADWMILLGLTAVRLFSVQIENITFHHEGFFWRCWFSGIVEDNNSNIWKFWYSKCSQPCSAPFV